MEHLLTIGSVKSFAMKAALEFALVFCFSVLVLGSVKLLNETNKRLLAARPIWGGRIQARGSRPFPVIPTNDSEIERKRPAVWLWALIDLFVMPIFGILLLATQR